MTLHTVQTPEEYLYYSKIILENSVAIKGRSKLSDYYKELCNQFTEVFCAENISFFDKMRGLLSVDAQIQILIELVEVSQKDLCLELGMTEEEIIRMIRSDKKFFYREQVGLHINQKAKWSLIYLDEGSIN